MLLKGMLGPSSFLSLSTPHAPTLKVLLHPPLRHGNVPSDLGLKPPSQAPKQTLLPYALIQVFWYSNRELTGTGRKKIPISNVVHWGRNNSVPSVNSLVYFTQ